MWGGGEGKEWGGKRRSGVEREGVGLKEKEWECEEKEWEWEEKGWCVKEGVEWAEMEKGRGRIGI